MGTNKAHFVPQYKELICGVSFGCNAGELNNTCSAVATSIALNYLATTRDKRLVPPEFKLERRAHQRCCTSGSNAERFHHYLINECGFAPKYHFGHLTWGVWGRRLKKGVQRYLSVVSERKAIGLEFHWRLRGIKRITASIDAGIPALITTWFGNVHDCGGVGGYGWHTMVVYGYRITSAGKIELAVHTGWDSSCAVQHAGNYVQEDIWLPTRAVFISYWFKLFA